MPNPAALLSANASLSGILGAITGGGTGSVSAAAGGTQGTDFSSLLSTSADLVPVSAAKPALPPSAPATDTAKDAFIASASDQATASSGKSLPLAALVSAALPVPVTLSALVKAPDTTTDTGSSSADDSDQPAAIDIANANAMTLMAVAHGTTAQQPPTAQPAATTTLACASLTPANTSTGPSFPTLAATDVQAAYTKDAGTGQTTRALPKPGFTLLPDVTSDTATTQVAASTGASTASSPQPAIAMADPAQLSTASAQPGFTLLADMTPIAAAQSPAITLTPDMTVAMAPSSSITPATPRLATTTPDTSAQVSATTSTAAIRVPQAAPTLAANAAPIITADPAVLSTDAASAPTVPVRLASARNNTQGKMTAVGARSATARTDTSVRPAIDLDAGINAGDPQPGFSAHSPTSPSADGASVLDNAPSLTQPLTSAGTAAVAQTLAATGGAATTPLATQQGGTDMAALVDRLVEARAAARSGLSSPVVQASLTHTDFGRVSLRFNSDEDGLSVSMASSDPGFAPAAQAALAQAPAVSASAQSHSAGQQNMGQQGSGQPGLHWAQSSAQPALQANTGGTGSSGQGGQGWTQGGQTNAPASQSTPAAQARAASTTSSTSPRNRGGILA